MRKRRPARECWSSFFSSLAKYLSVFGIQPIGNMFGIVRSASRSCRDTDLRFLPLPIHFFPLLQRRSVKRNEVGRDLNPMLLLDIPRQLFRRHISKFCHSLSICFEFFHRVRSLTTC